MLKPDESVIRALISLKNNPMWEEIVKWLDESLTTQSIKNNHNSGEKTIQMQGRNQELEEILTHINKAQEYLKNYRESGGKK